jgi:hypothetical protein
MVHLHPAKQRVSKLIDALKKWFGAEAAPSEESPTPQGESGVPADYADPGTPNDFDEDTSYDRRDPELSSTNVFDSPDTHRVRILQSDKVRPANDDDNPGYDPYDTGRFDTKS